MISSPIILYTTNLIDSTSQTSSSSNIFTITFSEAKQIDAFLIKNTTLTSVQIDYKSSSAQESWTSGPSLTQSQKQDKFFILPAQITAQIIRLTFNAAVDF